MTDQTKPKMTLVEFRKWLEGLLEACIEAGWRGSLEEQARALALLDVLGESGGEDLEAAANQLHGQAMHSAADNGELLTPEVIARGFDTPFPRFAEVLSVACRLAAARENALRLEVEEQGGRLVEARWLVLQAEGNLSQDGIQAREWHRRAGKWIEGPRK